LGFVFDLANATNPSALNGKPVYYDPSGGSFNGGTLQGNAGQTTLGDTASTATTQYPLVACCYVLRGNLDQTAELLKLKYKFSPVTEATVSYLGGYSESDQNGNTSDFTNAQFVPGDPAYSGSLRPGPVQVASVFPGAFSGETNSEPIVQAEVSSTIGRDTVLGRYYHASITRYQFQGTRPDNLDFNTASLYGVSSGSGNINATFNGTSANVGFSDLYEEPEVDKLSGGSFEYQHPIGNDMIAFAVNQTASQTVDYSIVPGSPGAGYSFNLPPGTSQLSTTYLLRGHFYMGPRLDVTLSDYLNTYRSTFPIGCPTGGCNTAAAAVSGTGVTFGTTNNTHDDPRVGFVYRPNSKTAVRFAAGSSIAPPFLGLLNQITSTPAYDATNHIATEGQSNGNLKPETGFGYDLGADVRLKDPVTVLSGDVYLTNLYNRFFNQTLDTGTVCSATILCTGGAPDGTPILNQTSANISNARFEGIELILHRDPVVGFGFTLSGALQKGYYYDLPPGFYCSIPAPNCTPDQNLNVIAGENVNGLGVGVSGLSFNGNMRIPYAQGNAEFSYTWRNGAYASFGETYYGKNNSLNEPPFGIAYGTLRYPIASNLTLQLSGDNIFNGYPGYLPIYGGGVPIPLYGGQSAATVGNVLGPATYRLILSTNFP
jgi:outer membrane receptor protein involved in Fe transport